jgi:hypothetical protein
MLRELAHGKEDLEKRPALRLQCWNATRWLGRFDCLKTLCGSYAYVLEHLAEFKTARGESSKDRDLASVLYERLTSYEFFLFIHLYRDLAGAMAKTTKQLQYKDIQISDVGRYIMGLGAWLKVNYSEGLNEPTVMIGDGIADEIMDNLFGNKSLPFAFEVNL